MAKNVQLKCSHCNKKLLNLLQRDENSDKKQTFQANCPFCNEYSEQVTITGHVYHGPIGKDESANPTTILDIEFHDDVAFFKLIKG